MVIDRQTFQVQHSHFDRLDDFLRPGDLLVFNSSRTLPAVLEGCEAPVGACMQVRLAEHLPDDAWLALLLCQQGEPFACGLRSGMQIHVSSQLRAIVKERDRTIPRLWKLRFSQSGTELINSLGTTVVRALESVVDKAGKVKAGHGYTRLRITENHKLKAVEGLLTGLHEPEASHLDLLIAFLPADVIQLAYSEAVEQAYLWHEFGDLNLLV
jgi:S-adenosylmethionine:tRNA-ribosyltransferase-isomerase (queuine synthetase)